MPKLNLFDRIDFEIGSLLEEKENVDSEIQKPSCFLSKDQIDEHYDVHYQGYLKNLKKAKTRLDKAPLDDANQNGGEYRSAMIDYAFNYNAVLLHETYFQCLGSKQIKQDLVKELSKTYGNKDKFMAHLKASLMVSRGWVTLNFNHDWELRLSILDYHGSPGIIACPPMALDCWEHSFYIDFKSNKEDYIDRLIEDINWEFVAKNVDKILSIK